MTNHLDKDQIERYPDRNLTPDELFVIHEHVATCEACRSRLKDGLPIKEAVGAMFLDLQAAATEEFHLDQEDISAYVNGNADPDMLDLMRDHFQTCRQCSEEMEDLKRFQASLASFVHPEQGYQPARIVPWWKMLTDRLRLSMPRFVIQTALPSIVTGVLVLVLLRRGVWNPLTGNQPNLAQERLQKVQQELAAQKKALDRQIQENQQVKAQIEQKQMALDTANKRYDQLLAEYKILSHPPPSVSSGNPLDQALIASFLEKGKIPLPAQKLAQLTTYERAPLGGVNYTKELIEIERPQASFVQTPDPEFAWKPVSEAVRYELNLVTIDQEKVVTVYIHKSDDGWVLTIPDVPSGSRPDTSIHIGSVTKHFIWRYPSEAMALKPGAIYRWSVRAFGKDTADEPIAESLAVKFQLLDEQTRKDAQRAQREYSSSPLQLSILYASYGLLDDAKDLLKEYLQSHPQDAKALTLMSAIRAKQAPVSVK